MPFEIPENIHPLTARLAWLIGRWVGNGHGEYPGIDSFQFGWAGKNLAVPLLMKEIRQLLSTPENEEFLERMRAARAVAEASMRPAKRKQKAG